MTVPTERALRVTVGWFLSDYENHTYTNHETGEQENPLAEVLVLLKQATGIDLTEVALALQDEAGEAVGSWWT